jgi:ubiquinone/menaquinone biosynthesis C-methylase UbiE
MTELVPDSRLGVWFQGTKTWRHRVLGETFAELERLLSPAQRYPVVLDVGCGQGQALALVAERLRPELLIGVDADARLLARARAEAEACACRVQLVESDARRLPLGESAVDLALCHQTLHHVRDQRGLLAELRRVLRPGGVLLLAESCRPFIRSLPVRALFRHPNEVQRSALEYLELLRASGFAFDDKHVAELTPWWSLRDLGLARRLGLARARPETTLVCVAATRGADA